MIWTVHFLELGDNIGHAKNYMIKYRLIGFFKYIKCQINVLKGLQSCVVHFFVVQKINAFWYKIKRYPINFIFDMVNFLGDL